MYRFIQHGLGVLWLWLLAGMVSAADFVAVSPVQQTALGLVSLPLSPVAADGALRLPGVVVVPNAQLRVIAAPAAGLVEEVRVAVGDTVRKGQVLARLASPDLLAVHREYQQAASQSDLADRALSRDETLYRAGIIPQARHEASLAAQRQARAAMVEKRQALQLAGVAVSGDGPSVSLRAPFDGVVLEQGVTVGQRVDAATLVFRLAQLHPLWIEIQAPASLSGLFRRGQSVQGGGAGGELIQVGHAVSSGQTVLLRARMDKSTAALRPGQHLEVQVGGLDATAGRDGLFRIPASALLRMDAGGGVFIERPASGSQPTGYQWVPVRVEAEQLGDLFVRGALKAGERVVVRGGAALKASLLGVGRS